MLRARGARARDRPRRATRSLFESAIICCPMLVAGRGDALLALRESCSWPFLINPQISSPAALTRRRSRSTPAHSPPSSALTNHAVQRLALGTQNGSQCIRAAPPGITDADGLHLRRATASSPTARAPSAAGLSQARAGRRAVRRMLPRRKFHGRGQYQHRSRASSRPAGGGTPIQPRRTPARTCPSCIPPCVGLCPPSRAAVPPRQLHVRASATRRRARRVGVFARCLLAVVVVVVVVHPRGPLCSGLPFSASIFSAATAQATRKTRAPFKAPPPRRRGEQGRRGGAEPRARRSRAASRSRRCTSLAPLRDDARRSSDVGDIARRACSEVGERRSSRGRRTEPEESERGAAAPRHVGEGRLASPPGRRGSRERRGRSSRSPAIRQEAVDPAEAWGGRHPRRRRPAGRHARIELVRGRSRRGEAEGVTNFVCK